MLGFVFQGFAPVIVQAGEIQGAALSLKSMRGLSSRSTKCSIFFQSFIFRVGVMTNEGILSTLLARFAAIGPRLPLWNYVPERDKILISTKHKIP